MMNPSVNSREGSFCIGIFTVFSDIINKWGEILCPPRRG